MDRNLAVREDNAVSVPELRARILELEAGMFAHPDHFTQLDTMNHFIDGVYVRTVLMKAGDVIVGKIHKLPHLVIVSAGRASVISEEFGAKEIVAPAVFKSGPGVKRVLQIHEDMIWSTIHHNAENSEDLGVLEDKFIAKDYSEVPEDVI